MAVATKSVVPDLKTLWLADVAGVLLTLSPGITAWGVTLLFIRAMWESEFLLLGIFISPFIACMIFVAAIFSLRCFVPRLEPGVYDVGMNRGMLAWYCHLALARASAVCGLLPMLQSFYVFKFLYWRALGAKIAYRVNTSLGVEFVDFPLISIASGSTLGEDVQIVCHSMAGNKLILAPVRIGHNVFVGAGSVVGLGTTIGDDVYIGFINRIYGDQVARGTQIDNFEWEYGNPASRNRVKVAKEHKSQDASRHSDFGKLTQSQIPPSPL